MPEVTTGSRGYKQADNKPINSCYIMFILVYSSFIILSYGFLYLLNLCIEFMYLLFLNTCSYLLFLTIKLLLSFYLLLF